MEFSDWQQAIERLVVHAHASGVQTVDAMLRQQVRAGFILQSQYVLAMSIVLEEIGRLNDALALLKGATGEDPDGAIRYRIGALAFQNRDYDAAIDAFMEIVDMGASIHSSFFKTATRGFLALALHAAGHIDAARRIARMVSRETEVFVGPSPVNVWAAVGLR